MTIKAPDTLLYAQRLANITDTAIRIPIVGISVGLDFFIGLIPVVGDAIMALVSLRIVYLARKVGMPKHLQKVMIRNSGLDFMFGFIPVVGDIVDLFFKANKTNVKIMETWWLEQNQQELDLHAQHKLREWQNSNV